MDGDIVRSDFGKGPRVPLLIGKTAHEFAFSSDSALEEIASVLHAEGVREHLTRSFLHLLRTGSVAAGWGTRHGARVFDDISTFDPDRYALEHALTAGRSSTRGGTS
ncbi:hypothetical protein ACU635_33555 [[Actinomadura] parvosata]|uniref:hypothetical protein n=1 Tax=[Actinomadura] parvosata TaxID=1955412 RepID=UPI00406BF8E7